MKHLVGLLLLGLSLGAHAQGLTAEDRAKTVDSLIATLDWGYVYPEVAKAMGEAIRKQAAEGGYDRVTDGRDFAELLTQDLQAVSHDGHLRVRFDPAQVAELNQSQLTPEEEEAFMQRQLAASRRNNFGMRELKMLPGNVGYFKFNGFSGWTEGQDRMQAAMQWLGDASAIIFDLRENGGGSPEMVQVITTYLFDEVQHLNSFYWRPTDEYQHFYTLPTVPGKRLADVPVYVLTSNYTFSAAEEFTYNLKSMERATIVGETTGGGAHPGGMLPVTDKFLMFLPQGRAINPITKTNWEGTGIEPHIAVPAPEALTAAHLDALQTLSKQAEEGSPEQHQLDWVIAELSAQQHPVTVSERLLKQYVGTYGPRSLTLVDGRLHYARDGRQPRPMTALSEDTFMVEGVDGFHLKIIKEGNKVVAVEGQYLAGHTDRNERN